MEIPAWVRWVSFLVAIAGILIISDFDWKTVGIFKGKYLFGNFLIFIGGCGSSFYNTYAKKLLADYTPLQVVLYGYVLSLVFTAGLLVWIEPEGISSFLAFGRATWISIGGPERVVVGIGSDLVHLDVDQVRSHPALGLHLSSPSVWCPHLHCGIKRENHASHDNRRVAGIAGSLPGYLV